MVKQLFSVFPALLIFALLFLPLMLIDFFIIHFIGGTYSSLVYLAVFLLVFYIADLLLNIVTDALLKAADDFSSVKINSHLISAIFDFIGSFLVISLLDFWFQSVDLSIGTKIAIVFLHTSLVFLIHNLQTEKDEQDTADPLPSTVEYEISQLLQKENLVTCIDLIKQKHPDIPKAAIIKAVRKINSESK